MGNKVGMKAPQTILLPNMAKKKDKEDYTTSVAQHILQLMQCSLSCLSFSPCSVAGQSRVLSFPPCFCTFYRSSLHDFSFYTKFFTPSFIRYLCVQGTEPCGAKIGNSANSPNRTVSIKANNEMSCQGPMQCSSTSLTQSNSTSKWHGIRCTHAVQCYMATTILQQNP